MKESNHTSPSSACLSARNRLICELLILLSTSTSLVEEGRAEMTSITNVCNGGRSLACRFLSTGGHEVKAEKVSVSVLP